MSLATFIPDAINWFAKTDGKLDALAKTQADAAELKAENAALLTRLATAEVKTHCVTVELNEAKATNTTLSGEITTLKAAVETERRRANDVIASQGLDPAKLPSTTPNPPTGATKPRNETEECIAARKAQASQ